MTDLGDVVGELLTGRPAGVEAPTLRERLAALREHYGSGRKAASAIGMSESVFRRALSGQTREPKTATVGRVDAGLRALGVRRFDNADIRINVTPRRGHGRERELKAKNLRIVDPQAAGRVQQAYVRGGQEEAAKQLLREIKDRHYRAWLCPDVYRVEVGADDADDYGYLV